MVSQSNLYKLIILRYAIYGWARWAYTPAKAAWHNLYRFSPFAAADT
jgi:hypothetical protein